jgi:hypothetical protein
MFSRPRPGLATEKRNKPQAGKMALIESEYLKLTAEDFRADFNPLNDPNLFQYTPTGTTPAAGAKKRPLQAEVETKIAEYEQQVLGGCPPEISRFFEGVNGERLVDYATDGQTEATLAIAPVVEGSVFLWRNFPLETTRFEDRHSRYQWEGLPTSAASIVGTHLMRPGVDYTVNLTSGLVTFTPGLVLGDQILADSRHTGLSRCVELRLLVKNLLTCYYGRTLPHLGDNSEDYDTLETTTMLELARLRDKKKTIYFFKRIPVLDPPESHIQPERLPPTGGLPA